MATMATLFIPAPLRPLCAGEVQVDLEAGSVRALIRALDTRYPGTAERLVFDDALRRLGRLSRWSNGPRSDREAATVQ